MNALVPSRRNKGFGSWVPEIFRKDFDNVWDNFFSDFDRAFGECCYENKEGDYVYELEVPGFSQDDLSVQIADGILEVKGERKISDSQRFAGQKTFYKRISIGDVQDAEASVNNGILTLTLKYPKEKVKEVRFVDVKQIEEKADVEEIEVKDE